MNIELKNKLMGLKPDVLISDLKSLVSDERKLKAEILHYLWVVQQKRVFAEFGYPSLFEFCTKHLGYTEAESQRRISAMRLMGEIPEIETKISEGTLSLSSLAMAQTLFRQEAKNNNRFTKDQKTEVLEALENKSVRECEKEILKFSTSPIVPQEKIKPISQEFVQVSFSAPKEFLEKLEKLKALRSHKNPNQSIFEIFDGLMDEALEKSDPVRKLSRSDSARAKPTHSKIDGQNLRHSVSIAQQVKSKNSWNDKPQDSNSINANNRDTKALPTQTKRELWQKHDSKCSFVELKTGQICNSRYFLETEHVKPRAMGGTHEKENLKLYCRAHNQLSAIKQFGFEHMDRFINS